MKGLRSNHIPALDGIRGAAILWVIAHNSMDLAVPLTDQLGVVGPIVTRGWIGVQMFFALSGFLITSNLLETQGATNFFRAFYARRTLRIAPLYFAFLGVLLYVVVPLAIDPTSVACTLDRQVWLWLFLTNWITTDQCTLHGFGHLWSLAVEEQFYLLWPLVVYRLAPRTLFWSCVGIALLSMISRSSAAFWGVDADTLYHGTLFRADALAAGSAFAAVTYVPEWQRCLRTRIHIVAASTVVVLVIGALLTHGYNVYKVPGQTIGYFILAIGAAALVGMCAIGTRPVWILSSGALRSVGKYSFAMYLFHVPLHKFFGEPFLMNVTNGHVTTVQGLLYALAIACLSYAAAFVSYHVFEKHFLRMKSYFIPRFESA